MKSGIGTCLSDPRSRFWAHKAVFGPYIRSRSTRPSLSSFVNADTLSLTRRLNQLSPKPHEKFCLQHLLLGPINLQVSSYRHFQPCTMTFTMTRRSTLKDLDFNENLISDTEFDVFDPVPSVGPIRHSLNALAQINPEDLQFLTRVWMFLCPFNVEQMYPFPELVYWCSEMYCHTAYILQN